MKNILISGLMALLCLAVLPAQAASVQHDGPYAVHYSAFHSSFLQPEVAAASGLVRSRNLGVLNVSVLKDGKGIPVKITGTRTNLAGQQASLEFKQVREQGAVYQLAQYPVESEDTLTFELTIEPVDADPMQLKFSQKVYPEQ